MEAPEQGERIDHGGSTPRRWAFATVGLAAGFTGLATIAAILTGIQLLLLEVGLVAVVATSAFVILRRAPRDVVRAVWRVARVGFVVGVTATLVYDVVRSVLSVFDPSPYNPFEAIRRFGIGMVGANAPLPAVFAFGFAVHFLNGGSFGIIYAIFGGLSASTLRAALFGGILWGLTLELVQSILYPGWLNITSVLKEFLLISSLGHIAYGATLGVGTHRLLRPASSPDVGP